MITIESRWAWLKIWVAALFLIFAAVLLMWRFQENRLVSSIAEAILVTGFLAVIVDPFLKRDLLAEAERGVFMHFLGFEHHPQVKARLRDIIFETKLLREHLQMVLTVDPTQDGFWVTIDYDSDLLNPTSLPVPYEPSVEWDMGHKPQLIRMSFMPPDGKVKWTEKNIPLKELEPGVQHL